MPDSNIKQFSKDKKVDYPQQQELLDRVLSLIYEYDGDISLAAALGLLDMAKDNLMANNL